MNKSKIKLFINICTRKYKKLIHQYKKYLLNGEYFLDQTGRIFYLSGVDRKIDGTFSSKYEKNNAKNHYKYSVTLRDNDEKEFNGAIMLLSSSMEEIKIFNQESTLVQTIFLDEKRYNKRKESFDFFYEIFPTPKILLYNDQEKFMVEEFIINDCLFSEDIYKLVLENFYNYFFKQSKSGKFEIVHLVDIRNDILTKDKYILNLYDSVLSTNKITQIPRVYLHGDFWSSNLLCNKDGYFLIDFEWANTYFVLYDYFTFMYNEYTLNKNKIYLNNYLSGLDDIWISNVFSLFNIQYFAECKKEYFKYFIIEMYFSRWKRDFSYVEKEVDDFLKEIQVL